LIGLKGDLARFQPNAELRRGQLARIYKTVQRSTDFGLNNHVFGL
jgi:hypothetical protein